MKKISKTERKRLTLLAQNKLEAAERVLLFSKIRFKKFDEVIEALYSGEDLSEHFLDRRINKINEAFNRIGNQVNSSRKHLRDALVYLSRNSRLIGGEDHIQAICNMISFRGEWIRKINDWKPSSKIVQEQVQQLAEFLFCRYAMPGFLYKVFLDKNSAAFTNWFIHIGNGGRIRDLKNIPIPFTQRMAHFFQLAPAKFSVPEALRWAQVKGLGGNDLLADRIAYSWLSVKPKGDEDFWNGFLLLLATSADFDHYGVGELIDYVREQKRANAGYSLKGRTMNSLVRQSTEWHRGFSYGNSSRTWGSCGVEGLQIRKKQEMVVLEELNSQRELIEESRTMKHCVSSYSFYCAAGRSSVFSMRKYVDGVLVEKLATIEINPGLKRIVQAKAKMNKPISDEARNYLSIWAGKEELTIGPYL